MGFRELLQGGSGFWKAFFPTLASPKGSLGTNTSDPSPLFCQP
jgi:hypothetical protein